MKCALLLLTVLFIAGCSSDEGDLILVEKRSVGPIVEVSYRRATWSESRHTVIKTDQMALVMRSFRSVPIGDTLTVALDDQGKKWISWSSSEGWYYVGR